MSIPANVLRATEIVRTADLPGAGLSDRMVLVELVSYISLKDPTQPVFPRISRIAEKTRIAEITVKRCLSRLRALQLIERLPQLHSEKTGNFRTVHTRLSEQLLRMIGLLPDSPARPRSDESTQASIPGDSAPGDTRPCITEIPAIENNTIHNKNSKSTAPTGESGFARKETLPEDLQPWVDQGISPAALATGMKLARQASTTLSAVLLAIGERLQRAQSPQAYLLATLRKIGRGDAPLWHEKRPESCLSPQEAIQREKQQATARDALQGKWFTDGKLFYRPTGSLCETYSHKPDSTHAKRPDGPPIRIQVLQQWVAQQQVWEHRLETPQDMDVSCLRKALSQCIL